MTNPNREPIRHAFSPEEHRQRLERARARLRSNDLDACICVGPELLYYFGGYDAHTHFSAQALIFGVEDDEPILIIRDLDIGRAEVTSWLSDVRLYRHGADDPAALVAQTVKEKLGSGRRIGVDLSAYALPAAYGFRLATLLSPAQLIDTRDSIDVLRVVKSDQEMAYIGEAAGYAEIGLEKAREVIRPGITELQLAGAIEAAMRDAGSEYPAMPVWIWSGPRGIGHKTPDHRPLQTGDCVGMEFAGVHRRYHAVTMQTVAVRSAPASYQKSYNRALSSLRAGASVIAPGVPVSRSEQAAIDDLVSNGADPTVRPRFGYGVSIAYPPTWLDPLDITLESTQVFERNTSFVLHIHTTDPETGMGALLGGAYAITEKGLERLSGGDLELAVL